MMMKISDILNDNVEREGPTMVLRTAPPIDGFGYNVFGEPTPPPEGHWSSDSSPMLVAQGPMDSRLLSMEGLSLNGYGSNYGSPAPSSSSSVASSPRYPMDSSNRIEKGKKRSDVKRQQQRAGMIQKHVQQQELSNAAEKKEIEEKFMGGEIDDRTRKNKLKALNEKMNRKDLSATMAGFQSLMLKQTPGLGMLWKGLIATNKTQGLDYNKQDVLDTGLERIYQGDEIFEELRLHLPEDSRRAMEELLQARNTDSYCERFAELQSCRRF